MRPPPRNPLQWDGPRAELWLVALWSAAALALGIAVNIIHAAALAAGFA